MPARLFDLLSAAIAPRLRALLFGAALRALAFGLMALFAVLAIGFGALAAYAALSAAKGQVVAAAILGGVCAGLALAILVVLARRRRAPAPPPTRPDPLIDALLATLCAQDQLARALTPSALIPAPTRLVALALSCGLAAGGLMAKRPLPKT